MASMTRTVAASGANHTTIADAMSYIVTNFTGYAGSDVATIQLIGAEEYNESNIALGGISGTASITSYLKIEATDAVKHDGTYNTSKARVRGTTDAEHVFNITDNFVHVKNLAIFQDSSPGTSDECIRLAPSSTMINALIEKCVFRTANIEDMDCIYAGYVDITSAYVFDCVFRVGGANARSAINAQLYATGQTLTQNWYIEHCTVDCNGSTDFGAGFEGGITAWAQDSTNTANMSVNNCAVFDPGTGILCYNEYDGGAMSGTIAWSGDGNISSDTSAETEFGATINFDSVTMRTADSSGEQYRVTDLTAGAEDYQLLAGATGTDVAIGGAVSGATRDARVDLTLDVAGNARPTTYTDRDIGAFQTSNPMTITDVDTDETWDDGDANLVITGTGFV